MLFDDWAMLARTALVVPLGYMVLLLVVRLSGKRALSCARSVEAVLGRTTGVLGT